MAVFSANEIRTFLKIEMMRDYFEHPDLNIFLVPKSVSIICDDLQRLHKLRQNSFFIHQQYYHTQFFCSNSWGRELRCFLASDQIDHIPDQIVERWYSFISLFETWIFPKLWGSPYSQCLRSEKKVHFKFEWKFWVKTSWENPQTLF